MIDENLYELVIEADDKLIEQAMEPHQRPIGACQYIADKLGISFVIGQRNSILVDAVHKIYEDLYRPQDLIGPPVHVGCCLFRDVFLEIKIPLIYGSPAVGPKNVLPKVNGRLTEWMFSNRDAGKRFYDQFFDLFDFAYGLDDIEGQKSQPDRVIEFFFLGKQQLQGASATVLGSFDKYTAIQSSLYSIELILKGALAAKNVSDNDLKNKYSHNLQKLSGEVSAQYPQMNGALVQAVCKRLPNVITRRYEAKDYARQQIGEIVMSAQYIAGEVIRQFSDRNIRQDFATQDTANEGDFGVRIFPIL